MSVFRGVGSPQSITLSGSSTATTNVIGANKVLIMPDVDIWFQVGSAPVASSSTWFCPAGAILPWEVQQNDKIAALPVVGTSGSVRISPVG